MDKSQWISALVNRHSRGLVRYVSHIVKDKEVAKEIVQECFLKLLQYQPEPPRDQVHAWLWRECRHRAIDSWRKNRKVDRISDHDDSAFGFASSNPLQDLETDRDLKEMHAAITQLSAKQREALFLKYKDGLSYKEIAEVMGLSATNVGFILHEAMTQLKEMTGETTRARWEIRDGAPARKYGK